MRFAYFCSDPGVPVFGTKGASIHIREVVGALRRQGHSVKVFAVNTGDETGDMGEEACQVSLAGFASECVELIAQDLPATSFHLVSEWKRLLYSEQVQRKLLPAMAAFQPDAIYERYSLFNYAGIELARELQIPLTLEVNAPLALESSNHRGLILKHTAAEMERRILCAADSLIVVSTALARHVRELGVPDERITVLPNGVDATRFDPTLSGAEVRRTLDLDGKQVIGFVGNRRPWHDLDTVLAAMKLLVERDLDVRLLLVGESFEQEISKGGDVVRAIRVKASEVPKHLAAMDVVVVPYDRDADTYFSPLKLYEAMAMAKPVVGAAVGQVDEVLSHGDNGLVYQPGEAADLAGKITEILTSPDRGSALGAAARKDVLATYTWDAKARQIADIARVRHASLAPHADSFA